MNLMCSHFPDRCASPLLSAGSTRNHGLEYDALCTRNLQRCRRFPVDVSVVRSLLWRGIDRVWWDRTWSFAGTRPAGFSCAKTGNDEIFSHTFRNDRLLIHPYTLAHPLTPCFSNTHTYPRTPSLTPYFSISPMYLTLPLTPCFHSPSLLPIYSGYLRKGRRPLRNSR